MTIAPDSRVEVYEAFNHRTAIRFIDEVRPQLPICIHVVQTDNGAEFQSRLHWHVKGLDARQTVVAHFPTVIGRLRDPFL